MHCGNHPEEAAAARCAGCAESFCADCLVEIHGQHYCGDCKVMTVTRRPAVLDQQGALALCGEARDALIYSCLGVLCFIFAIIGASKASTARQLLASNRRLAGHELAQAARIIAWMFLGYWGVSILLTMVANLSAS
jgi:hypothetical protein